MGQVVVGVVLVVGLLPYLWALRGMHLEAVWIPLSVVGLTLVLALANLGLEIRRRTRAVKAERSGDGDATAAEGADQSASAAPEPIEEWDPQSTRQLTWIAGMVVVVLLFGLLLATVAYIAAYLLVETQLRIRTSAAIVALYTIAVYSFFIDFLGISPLAPSLIL